MAHTHTDSEEAVRKVRDLIKGIDTAMLTTVSADGLVTRPMKTQEVEFDGDLCFLTKKDTNNYRELLNHSSVNVAYEKLLDTTYDDPNLVLVKVKAETAEYWETGSKIKMVAHLFKRLTGRDVSESDLNKTVEMNA
ncbi:pyridoxamine 5'-phosphate oxidase family protein [Cohnella sp. REN36]|uniref:pyridoxamine 5'-phosphate oxidase family protein n=1 Tax=Cohnella sp. REN36 TaxID=2887347 RepID=UPI001D137714|nr:pyridoxamine 5'-phosphate oxidase family protein [Cohnella sp. REN36]MCC3372504.1 pyridoxamine 5'-phosphate oxidase family protein [Cohnella sp. REN36]